MRILPFLLAGLTGLLSTQALAYSDIEVIAETTGCNGESGFTTFEPRKLHKISDAWCNDPNDASQKLQQVMIKSRGTTGGFKVIWVTKSEARNIMQQIKEGRSAKLHRAYGPNVRIDVHNHDGGQAHRPHHPPHNRSQHNARSNNAQNGAVAQNTRSPIQTPAIEMDGPSINILDPAIASTRSISKIMTSADLSERVIIGKVDAPAGLISVTVNGASAEFDQNGVFKSKVTLEKDKTTVDVIAIDKQGKRHNVEFHLHKALPEGLKIADSNSDDEYGNYYALIIANTQYQHMDPLITPANDAKVLGELLQNKFGFNVTNLNDATRYQMMTALNDVRSKLTDKDNLLIYYAGHGAFDKTNNRGHWLPTDAEPTSTANWISTIAITDIVNSMSAKHVLLVADSCYSGALTRNTAINLDAGMSEDARNQWLRTMAKTPSRHLLTSGGIKPVLDDGGNGHSVFASAFIDVLKQSNGIIESSDIFMKVKRKVEIRAKELNVEQTPLYAKLQESEHEFGEFLLVPKTVPEK